MGRTLRLRACVRGPWQRAQQIVQKGAARSCTAPPWRTPSPHSKQLQATPSAHGTGERGGRNGCELTSAGKMARRGIFVEEVRRSSPFLPTGRSLPQAQSCRSTPTMPTAGMYMFGGPIALAGVCDIRQTTHDSHCQLTTRLSSLAPLQHDSRACRR